MLAQGVGFEHPHPHPLHPDHPAVQRSRSRGKSLLIAIRILPVECHRVRKRLRPFRALQFGHDRQHLGPSRYKQQRRSLHQVELQSRQIGEIRPRHKGERAKTMVADNCCGTGPAQGVGVGHDLSLACRTPKLASETMLVHLMQNLQSSAVPRPKPCRLHPVTRPRATAAPNPPHPPARRPVPPLATPDQISTARAHGYRNSP